MSDMQVILTELKESVKNVAVEAVESLLMVDAEAGDDWEVFERLSGNHDHIITLGCSNSDYQGVIMFGVNDEDALNFCESAEEVNDLFGEIANTYCGMLMDQEGIADRFGFLSQAIPMYAAKRAFFPRAWAISGKVLAGGVTIQVGFAVRGFMSLLNK